MTRRKLTKRNIIKEYEKEYEKGYERGYAGRFEYVRYDVYDTDIRRLEFTINKNHFDLRVDNEKLRTDLTERIDNVRTELKLDNEKLRAELKLDNKNLRAELKEDINSVRTELTERISTVEKEVKALGVKLDGNVDTLAVAINKLDTRIDGIEKRMDDMHQDFHQSQNRTIALWGIIVTVVISLVQYLLK